MPRRLAVSVSASQPSARSVAQWPPKTAPRAGSTRRASRGRPATSGSGWNGHSIGAHPTSPIAGPDETPTSIVPAGQSIRWPA